MKNTAQPPSIGILTTRVIYTEREPIHSDPSSKMTVGQIIGQAIDDRLAIESNKIQENGPVIHSIAFEFPL